MGVQRRKEGEPRGGGPGLGALPAAEILHSRPRGPHTQPRAALAPQFHPGVSRLPHLHGMGSWPQALGIVTY